ncbi:S1 family peptidase [Streptomyces alboniger]|uniref:S1 family peptidase n=1 Tax=Streptomyces alboniger TaxID=132473 RepID=UPI0006E35718|nr:serine protease [Streptomyces alboniger]
MVYDEYFIEIFRDDRRLGSGVRLTRDFALTAAHCLEERELEGRAAVRLGLPDGKDATGEVQDYDRASDLALLRLIFQKDEDVQLPGVCFDDARPHEPWKATHQLPDGDDVLRGSVAEVSYVYGSTGRGGTINALRLDCDWVPDDCTLFAGSPVERGDPYRPPVVLGLIVQHRAGGRAPDGTLFAGTVREAVTRFKRFRFRIEDLAGDPAPPLAVRPFAVGATETEKEILIRTAVEDALDKAGFPRVVRVHWTRR